MQLTLNLSETVYSSNQLQYQHKGDYVIVQASNLTAWKVNVDQFVYEQEN